MQNVKSEKNGKKHFTNGLDGVIIWVQREVTKSSRSDSMRKIGITGGGASKPSDIKSKKYFL